MIEPINARVLAPSVSAPKPPAPSTSEQGGVGGAPRSPQMDRVTLSSAALESRPAGLVEATSQNAQETSRVERTVARSVVGDERQDVVQGPGRGGGEGGSEKLVQQLMERARTATRTAYDAGGSPAVAAVPAGVLIQVRA